MKRLWISAAVAVVAFASPASANTAAQYNCANGQVINAVFKTPSSGFGSVALHFTQTNQTSNLPQVPSADGGRYSDAHTEFWIKGNGATLTHNGKSTNCRTN
jgi:membrane-bound inhibitor of C-type lysozyme